MSRYINNLIKDCADIYKSFEKYTEEEILDGSNIYEAEGHGKQEARKGVSFIKFPNILIIQLKRFEYDFTRDQRVKNNDKFEYFKHLDLNKFTNTEGSNENNYTLHSVVAHSGNAYKGHYYSYLNPSPDEENWLLFNDETVHPAGLSDVYENNFGGHNICYSIKNKGRIISQLNPCEGNAYILVYIKDSSRKEILKNITVEDVRIVL